VPISSSIPRGAASRHRVAVAVRGEVKAVIELHRSGAFHGSLQLTFPGNSSGRPPCGNCAPSVERSIGSLLRCSNAEAGGAAAAVHAAARVPARDARVTAAGVNASRMTASEPRPSNSTGNTNDVMRAARAE